MCQPANQHYQNIQQHQQQHQLYQQRKVNKDISRDDKNAGNQDHNNLIPKLETIDSSASIEHNRSSNAYIYVSQHQHNVATNQMSSGQEKLNAHQQDTLPYFNETLELSQEDIQKTLSANMPMGSGTVTDGNSIVTNVSENLKRVGIAREINMNQKTKPNEDIVDVLNPMDFIENCCDVNGDVGVSNVHDDDVFVNLDAFDMFVEFPDLDLDTKNSLLQEHSPDSGGAITDMDNNENSIVGSLLNGGELEHQHQNIKNGDNILTENIEFDSSSLLGQQQQKNDNQKDLYNISDYSPEWAYPEGGIKVLVTGPWDHNSNYTVLFDSFPVPTTVVQTGVLRCFCPAHEVGLATLQVACNGHVISNSCIFEYKSPKNVEMGSICDGTTNVSTNIGGNSDSVYKISLYNRLESIDERMQIKTEPTDSVCYSH